VFDELPLEEPASEFESARRSLGWSSSLLFEELSSRLGVARCRVGRPLSLVLSGGLDDPVSSDPEARCSVGRSPPLLPDELLSLLDPRRG